MLVLKQDLDEREVAAVVCKSGYPTFLMQATELLEDDG